KHLSRTKHDARQRIVGDGDWKTSLFANALIKVLEQRTAAGKHNSSVADVGAQLWRGSLQSDTNRIHDRRNTFAERLADFTVIDGDGLWNPFDEIAALDLHGQRLIERIS